MGKYFLVVLLVSVFFYSVSFTALYIGKSVNDDDVDDDLAGLLVSSEGSNALWMPFLMIFNMGVLGDFSTAAFEHSVNRTVTFVLFMVFIIHTTVILLNGIIALLGDSFERVQERKVVEMNINRAQLILDYLYVLGERARNEIEGMSTTLYRITPHSMEGNNSGDDEWMGRIKFMTRMHKETREKIDQAQEMNGKMIEDMNAKIDEAQKETNAKIDQAQEMNVKMIEDMNAKIDQAQEMNGKMIEDMNAKIDEAQKETNAKIDQAQEMNVKMIEDMNQKIDENFLKIAKLLRGAEPMSMA